MSLTVKIAADLMAAMKAKDLRSLEALRAAKTAFILGKSEKGADAVLTPEEEIKIIQKLVKQRKESAEIYRTQNRPELCDKELSEAEVLERYLPAKPDSEELTRMVRVIIERVGAKTESDMGRVMAVATKELAGKADGKEISLLVRQLLG